MNIPDYRDDARQARHGRRFDPGHRIALAPLAALVALATSAPAAAFDPPRALRVADGQLCWQSDAPSINVYQNDGYLLTLHDERCFGQVSAGSAYRVVAHDRGREFSARSETIVAEAGDGDVWSEDDDPDDDFDDDFDDDLDDDLEFGEAELYFELNATDGDLGIHASIDGQIWDRISIETPEGRTIFELDVFGTLQMQGMTELFFESHEPLFDELSPAQFFLRFPEGRYEIEGVTVEGEDISAEVELAHVIPAPPSDITVGGLATPRDGCDEDPGPSVSGDLHLSWTPVTRSHPTIGRELAIELDAYEIAMERINEPTFEMKLMLDPTLTSVTLPRELLLPGDEVKIEVLAIADSSSRTATEACFTVGN